MNSILRGLMEIVGPSAGQTGNEVTKTRKLYSPIELVRDVIVCLLFAASLASAQILKCTSPINDPKIIKSCERQCSTDTCPSYCNCKPLDATDSCSTLDFAPNKFVSVRENLPAGTNIFSIVVRGSETWSFNLGRSDDVDGSAWTDLKSYLAFKRFGDKYEMIVNKTLDLENIFKKNSIRLSTLILILDCKRPDFPTETMELLLQVIPVNEFAPQFIGAPFHLTIKEDTSIGTKLIQMDRVTIDRDVNPATRELSRFAINDYINVTQRDGQSYFSMDNIQKGIIILKNPVDFEALSSLGSPRFMLNVSAADIEGLKAYTQIQIDVTDVDDLPPEFFHPSCPLHIRRLRPCPVSFEADVPVGYKGRVGNIRPQDIQAHDMDALDAAITYTLYSGPGETKANADKFSINETTGALYLTSSFLVATHVDLVVVASENTTKHMTTQAPLKIFVKDMPIDAVRIENSLRPILQPAGERTADDKDDIEDNPLYLSVLIVLISLTLLLIIIIAIMLFKMKCAGRSNPTVHPVMTDATYDEPSSYHYSHDETLVSKSAHLPSHGSDPLSKANPPQNSEKNTESQMTSNILSSTSHVAKNNAQKVSPNHILLSKEKTGPRLAVGSPFSTGNKTSESDEETVFSSNPSSLKSSPLPPAIPSAASPKGYATVLSSQYGAAKNDRMRYTSTRTAMSSHTVMPKRSSVSNIEDGKTSVASSGRRLYTYPIAGHRPVSKGREKTRRYYKSNRNRRSGNVLGDQHGERSGKESRGPSQRLSSHERRIRIPSGVLVMTSSYEDHALDQSGEDSNDSTLHDEPMIDVFHESPSVFYHGTLHKETAALNVPKENNVLSLLPENLQSESDNGEVLTLTKSSRGKLAPVHGIRPDHVLSPINPGPEDNNIKTRNKNFKPQPINTPSKEIDFRTHSQATTGARSMSLIMTPDDESTVGSLRPVSEVDAMIRRKKKRRRMISQQGADKFTTPVSQPQCQSQGDDRSRENQKRPSSNSKTVEGQDPQNEVHKHHQEELGQIHTGPQDSSSGVDN